MSRLRINDCIPKHLLHSNICWDLGCPTLVVPGGVELALGLHQPLLVIDDPWNQMEKGFLSNDCSNGEEEYRAIGLEVYSARGGAALKSV